MEMAKHRKKNGTLLRRRSKDEETTVNVNHRHSKKECKSKGRKERDRERKSMKLPQHGEFKTSVARSSKVGNSICGLAVEKFRQFESLPASRGFTVNFFRIFPPRDFRGPLHTAYQRQRSSVSLGKRSLSLVRCLTLISLTSFFSRNENLRHVPSSLRPFSSVIHRQWRFAICSDEPFMP